MKLYARFYLAGSFEIVPLAADCVAQALLEVAKRDTDCWTKFRDHYENIRVYRERPSGDLNILNVNFNDVA